MPTPPDSPPHEEPLAELLGAVLAGRQERVLATALAAEPPETRAAFGAMTDAMATLGVALEPEAPSASLRDRVLQSVAARRAPRSRKALVVLDMLMDHLTPGSPSEVPRARAIVPALAARLEAARAEGTPVVYVVDQHDPEDADLDAVDGWGVHNVRAEGGPAGAVWPDLAPRDGDLVVTKSTYSAFTASELARVLDDAKVDTIVLTGCLTEIGLMATATDALQRGFVVEVPGDAQAGANEAVEQVTLGVLAIMPPYGPARRARLEALGMAA
jgi:nicotinamidase-related amidase